MLNIIDNSTNLTQRLFNKVYCIGIDQNITTTFTKFFSSTDKKCTFGKSRVFDFEKTVLRNSFKSEFQLNFPNVNKFQSSHVFFNISDVKGPHNKSAFELGTPLSSTQRNSNIIRRKNKFFLAPPAFARLPSEAKEPLPKQGYELRPPASKHSFVNRRCSLLLRSVLQQPYQQHKHELKQKQYHDKNTFTAPSQLTITQWNSAELISADMLMQSLKDQLKRSVNARSTINYMFRNTTAFIRNMGTRSPVIGMAVTATGRLGSKKKAMAQQISRSVGTVGCATFHQKIDYCQSVVSTRRGLVGLKIWVCYAA